MTRILGTGHTTVDLNDLTAVPYLNRYWQMLRYINTFTLYNTLMAFFSKE